MARSTAGARVQDHGGGIRVARFWRLSGAEPVSDAALEPSAWRSSPRRRDRPDARAGRLTSAIG